MGAHRAAGVLLLSFCTANAWFSGVARSEELHKLRQADHRKNHDGLLVGALMPTPPNLRSAAMMPLPDEPAWHLTSPSRRLRSSSRSPRGI